MRSGDQAISLHLHIVSWQILDTIFIISKSFNRVKKRTIPHPLIDSQRVKRHGGGARGYLSVYFTNIFISTSFNIYMSQNICVHAKNYTKQPWLVWLSGLSTSLRTKGSPVQFPVGTPAWVMGQVPWWEAQERHPPIDVSLPLFLPSFPSL